MLSYVIAEVRDFFARLGAARFLGLLLLASALVILAGTCGVVLGHGRPYGKGHGPTSTVTSTTLPGAACATATDVEVAIRDYCQVAGPQVMLRKCRRTPVGRLVCTRTYLVPANQVQP